MEDAKRQTLARIVRAGAEEMLPRQLALLEQICAIDSGTGNEAGNAAVTGLLEPVLSELGARTERVTEPGLGTHLVARVRPERPRGKVLLPPTWTRYSAPALRKSTPFILKGSGPTAWGRGLQERRPYLPVRGADFEKGGPAAPLGADVPFHL